MFTCERARRIESGLILVSVCESPAPCERPCVYRVVGRTVSIGRPLLPLHLLCACQRTELTGPALEREGSKLSPTLSPPPSLSLSPPLAHSRLTFHSDNIQGPKPLLHLLSSSPSFRPSVPSEAVTMRLGISGFITDILSTSSNICFCWAEGKVESSSCSPRESGRGTLLTFL